MAEAGTNPHLCDIDFIGNPYATIFLKPQLITANIPK